MANHLGPLEILCDAPSYAIVRACREIGIRSPEDVRWCRLSAFLTGSYDRHEILSLQAWKKFLGMAGQRDMRCDCGQALPRLEKYVFTSNRGEKQYLLGQCDRCQTIFWDEC